MKLSEGRKPHTKATDDIIRGILELLKQNRRVDDIAELMGVSVPTVYKIRRNAGCYERITTPPAPAPESSAGDDAPATDVRVKSMHLPPHPVTGAVVDIDPRTHVRTHEDMAVYIAFQYMLNAADVFEEEVQRPERDTAAYAIASTALKNAISAYGMITRVHPNTIIPVNLIYDDEGIHE